MFDWIQPVQACFSDLEYAAKKRKTRRDRFLAEIESVTPWAALLSAIESVYPKGEGRGRPPIGLLWREKNISGTAKCSVSQISIVNILM